jgi:hypothetical protein
MYEDEMAEYKKSQLLHKESLLNMLDTFDKLNKSNLDYLNSTKALYELKLKEVEKLTRDAGIVDLEAIALRAEIVANAQDFSQAEKMAAIDKIDELRKRATVSIRTV